MGRIEEIYDYLNSDKAKTDFEKRVNEDTWEQGLPKIYMDEEGRIVRHWKDGKIEIIKNKMKTYEQAQKELLNTEWRVIPCFAGKECWCRMIEPVNPPTYEVTNSKDEIELEVIDSVIGAAAINKEMAEYIVDLHNKNLK